MSRRSTALRRRDALHSHSMHFGPNMTPMVDVVMVILIFFMASAAILGPEVFVKSSLPVEAAGNTAPPTDPPARLRLILDAGGVARVGLNDEEPIITPLFSVETRLREELAKRGRDGLIVLVEPQGGASYDDVVRVHEWCSVLGITKVGLVEKPKEPEPK